MIRLMSIIYIYTNFTFPWCKSIWYYKLKTLSPPLHPARSMSSVCHNHFGLQGPPALLHSNFWGFSLSLGKYLDVFFFLFGPKLILTRFLAQNPKKMPRNPEKSPFLEIWPCHILFESIFE